MNDLENLNEMYFDILREIGNIGAGNAVTALAKMLGKKVDMPVPAVNLVEFKDIAEFIGGPGNLVAGVLISLTGDINGIMMFLLEMPSADNLVNIVMGDAERATEGYSEIELSAVQEIGNILSASYVNSLAELTGTMIVPSVPFLSIDMANAILSVPAIEFGKVADRVLFIESSFEVDKVNVSGFFILVPDMPSFTRIMHALGVQ